MKTMFKSKPMMRQKKMKKKKKKKIGIKVTGFEPMNSIPKIDVLIRLHYNLSQPPEYIDPPD